VTGPLYPNQPLVEVASEIRFRGELSVEDNRARFQSAIADRYPNLHVPKAKEGVSPPLQPYRFESDEVGSGIQVAINKFGYYSKDYPGHEAFIEEMSARLSDFLTFIGDLGVTRIGWRYINAIPYTREKGQLPFNRYFKDNEYFGNLLGHDLTNAMFRFTKENNGIGVFIKLGSGEMEERPGEEILLLDVDCYRTLQGDTKMGHKKIMSLVREAHDGALQVFESMIADRYRAYLKGDKNE